MLLCFYLSKRVEKILKEHVKSCIDRKDEDFAIFSSCDETLKQCSMFEGQGRTWCFGPCCGYASTYRWNRSSMTLVTETFPPHISHCDHPRYDCVIDVSLLIMLAEYCFHAENGTLMEGNR